MEIKSRVVALLQETFLAGKDCANCEGSCFREEQAKTVITWRDLEDTSEKCRTTSTLCVMLVKGKKPAVEDVLLEA